MASDAVSIQISIVTKTNEVLKVDKSSSDNGDQNYVLQINDNEDNSSPGYMHDPKVGNKTMLKAAEKSA